MCTFVTAAFPAGSDLESLRAIARPYPVALAPLENPFVLAQLPPGEVYASTTRGMCDCGTILGWLSRYGRRSGPPGEREIRRLRRKGWSGARIERWLAEKHAADLRGEVTLADAMARRVPEADAWLGLLRALLGEGGLAHVALLIHWYTGGLETERIALQRQEQLPLAAATPDLLMRLEEDVGYQFVP